MIGGRRPLQGRKPGDRRVRVERPHAPYFRYTGPGQLTAKEAASVPTTPAGRAVAHDPRRLPRPAAGREEELGERLSKTKALAIFSSDAISSSAYATEEILRVFILAGAALAALTFALPVRIAIAVLLGVVAFRYRQICIAYPTGGGSYSVSKANIGRIASPRRGVGPADRLRPDGRRLDVVGGRADRLGLPGALRRSRSCIGVGRDRADHDRQPARPARGRQHLRGPDLPVRRSAPCS